MEKDPSERISVHAQYPETVGNLTTLLEGYIQKGRSNGNTPASNDVIDTKSQQKWQKLLGDKVKL